MIGAPREIRTPNTLLLRQVSLPLDYEGNWLAQVESNHRPLSYQDSATTAELCAIEIGRPSRIRTEDILIKSQAL